MKDNIPIKPGQKTYRERFFYRDGGYIFFAVVLAILVLNVLFGIILSKASINLESTWVVYISSVLTESIFLLSPVIYSKVNGINFKKATKVEFKFNWKVFLLVILIALVIFFCSINSTKVIELSLSKLSIPPPNINLVIDTFWEFLLYVLVLTLIPAICEEFLFRGAIYTSLSQKFGEKAGILLSAVLFTLIHFSIFQTAHQFVMGIMLGLLVYFTGTIFYGIIFHFINNFLVIFLTYLKIDKIFIFKDFSAQRIVLSFVIFLLGILVVSFLFFVLGKMKKKREENIEEKVFHDDKMATGMLVIAILLSMALWAINSFGGSL